jgi:hypothetical protein
MTALLLYSYCCGIYSSRRIAKACRERVDFMSIVALDARISGPLRWSRLSEQIFRVDKWSACRG